jgi:two-component system phosphate regulon sensor histidine kinase PhoR
MRRDFVANASHELRSPLTVINGYLDVMAEDENLPEAWENPVKQMQVQATRMRQILGELLELSRLEGAGAAASDKPVDVLSLIDSTIEALGGHSKLAPVTVDAKSSSKLFGNSAEIETVVLNLLSNAFRHTPVDGRISVTWETGTGGADLIVTDTGEGIDPEYIPRLTERFFRVDKGRSRDDGGVGLGLAIVKHVLARHDAELTVSSVAGEGSEFRCHFPPERIVVDTLIPL